MPKSMFTKEYECLIGLLAEIRQEKGVTQVELAASLKKPQSFVSKIETGERRLDLIELIAIADALYVAPTEVLERLEAMLSRPVRI